MSRLYSHCPICNAEVFVARAEWNVVDEIPDTLSVPAHCKACDKDFVVNAANAALAPVNSTGKLS